MTCRAALLREVERTERLVSPRNSGKEVWSPGGRSQSVGRCEMRRLAIADPSAAGSALLTVATSLLVYLIGVVSMGGREAADVCRFEQTWYAGDVHYHERIELRADSTGTWIETGAASDARRDRKEFTWERTAITLEVTYDRGKKRSVEYQIERSRNACYLTFRLHPFLDDDSGFHQFADYP